MLHLGVDASGAIVARVLTNGHADDATTVPDLLGQVEGELSGFVADAAYDARLVDVAATAVPLTRTLTASGSKRRLPVGRLNP